MHTPRILHFDADAFFCQCAYLAWPQRLAGVDLLVIGGHPERRGVVASCSYGARRYGVHSAMSMAHALRLCPEAVAAPVPRAMVRRKSRELAAVLRRFVTRLEMASVDEGYALLPESPEPFAELLRRIQRAVKEESEVTVSIGGGSNRLIAKLATTRAKPAGIHVVPPGEEYDFVGAHELGDIPGVGPAFLRDLERRGITSIAAARRLDPGTLTGWLGPARARFLWERIRAIASAEIRGGGEPRKSISAETTFDEDVQDALLLQETLRELVADVGRTLRRERYRARTIGVKLRTSEFLDRQRSHTLPQAVETDRTIDAVAQELLARLRRLITGRVRLLGVSLSNLTGPGSAEQLAFPEIVPPLETDADRERERAAGHAPR